ncbi:hypothetical protein IAT38_004197 [Cryptococcus sp. DSM 104549]
MNVPTSILKAKRRRLYLDSPPYMTPMPHARVGFDNLPMELVEMIIGYAGTFYGLLLTCKRTCALAGERLYANGPVIASNHPSTCPRIVQGLRMRYPNLEEVMYGLGKGGCEVSRPFGDGLKRRFVSKMTGLRYKMMSVKTMLGSHQRTLAIKFCEARETHFLFQELYTAGLEPFSALQDIIIDFKRHRDDTPRRVCDALGPYTGMLLALAQCCRPRTWEWSGQQFPISSASSCRSPGELRFAGGHLPLSVTHNVPHHHSVPLAHHPIPFACYGTHNIVHIRTLEVGDETEAGCMGYMNRVTSELHPEATLESLGKLGGLEVERRDATTWEFAWSAPCMSTDEVYPNPMETLEWFLDALERLSWTNLVMPKGRVTITSPDMWRRTFRMDLHREEEEGDEREPSSVG